MEDTIFQWSEYTTKLQQLHDLGQTTKVSYAINFNAVNGEWQIMVADHHHRQTHVTPIFKSLDSAIAHATNHLLSLRAKKAK